MTTTGVFVAAADLAALIKKAVTDALQEQGASGDDGWLDRAGAGRYLSMSPKAIDAASARGQLPYHLSLTGRRRYLKSELDAWATAQDETLARSA
jgi:hypothetical protein